MGEDAVMGTAGSAVATLAAVAALACAALTGCGSAAATADAHIGRPPAAQAPAGQNVCGHTRNVDRLTIGRVNSFPQNPEHFTFPAQVTVTSAGRSQAVAQELCALPAMPAGTFSCPGDWGIDYRLVFTAGDRKLAPVTVDATGCQTVKGAGPVRWTAVSPDFWSVLATAAGIGPADQTTFAGTL
jgi:hypothetical protein